MSAANSYLIILFVVWFSGGFCWKQLPKIPAGRRAEYYLQQSDGGYKYAYDTGEGSSAVVDADASNSVRGRFQYVDGVTGRNIQLAYTAGVQGFVPEEVVASPDSSVQTETGRESETNFQDADYDANADASYSFNIDTDSYKRTESADSRGNVRGKYSYSSREGGTHGLSYIAGENTGFVVTSLDPAQIATDHVNGGASKPFAYNTVDQRRDELDNGKSSARGSCSFRNHVAVAALPSVYSVPVIEPVGTIIQPDGSYAFSYDSGDHSREEKADSKNNVQGTFTFKGKDDKITRRVNYKAGADTGFIATGDHIPAVPKQPNIVTSNIHATSDNVENVPGDASYSFSYNAKDHSRQESSDAGGNVKGTFSFIASDGIPRQVDYEAGAGKGFLAKGSHLPVSPELPEVGAGLTPLSTEAEEVNNVRNSYSFGTKDDGKISRLDYKSRSKPEIVAIGSHVPGALGGMPSYSFSYSTEDHSREEAADHNNNVKGSYSFVAKDDGKSRRVDYEAGSATGFLARGSHLPVAPNLGLGLVSNSHPSVVTSAENGAIRNSADGSYSFSFDTTDQINHESGNAANDVESRSGVYATDANTGPHIPSVPSSSDSSYVSSSDAGEDAGGNGDASYSYSYETDSSSKSESSDSEGNVKGIYSYRAGDGITRTLKYTSRGNEGFVVQEDGTDPAFPQALAVSRSAGGRNYVLHKYLPPENKHKFGYILDTTA